MLEKQLLSGLTFLGLLFIVLGIVLLLIPILMKIGLRVEEVHPLILWGKRLNGIYVGTSPLLMMILIAIYLLLLFTRRG